MKKQTFEWHGKKYFLIGVNEYGERLYLEDASWDCGWYWGFGYVESFTNNTRPWLSRDISCHTHFDSLWLKGKYDDFLKLESPLTKDEKWQLLELMQSFYTVREYAELCNRGGSHYTESPCKDILENADAENQVNKVVIPAIVAAVKKILDPVEK